MNFVMEGHNDGAVASRTSAARQLPRGGRPKAQASDGDPDRQFSTQTRAFTVSEPNVLFSPKSPFFLCDLTSRRLMTSAEWSLDVNNLPLPLVLRERRPAAREPLNQRRRSARVLADLHAGERAPSGDRHGQQELVLKVGARKGA